MCQHPPATTIDLLRHGEAVGGARYRGKRDDPLTPRGWEQMWSAVHSHCQWGCVISSPLARCAAFARELARCRALPLTIDERLREFDFGDWEGSSAAELLTRDPDGVARFWNDPLRHPPPGAEPWPLFRERVQAAWNELTGNHAGKHLLIVSHGGPIRMILGQVLDLPFPATLRLELPHASISRVRIDVGPRGRPHFSLVFHAGRL